MHIKCLLVVGPYGLFNRTLSRSCRIFPYCRARTNWDSKFRTSLTVWLKKMKERTTEVMGEKDQETLSPLSPTMTTSSDTSTHSQILGGLPHHLEETLPSDLYDEVLARLPPSALLRSRSLCRRMSSFDPFFIEFYDATPRPAAVSMLIISYERERRCSTALYLESFSKWFQLPLDFLPNERYILVAEAGGLICLQALDDMSALFTCNPLMRSWRRLPDCTLDEFIDSEPHVHMVTLPQAAYKIIAVGLTIQSCRVVKIYHSARGVWTRHTDEIVIQSLGPSHSYIFEGVMYWNSITTRDLYMYDLEEATWSHRRKALDMVSPLYRSVFLKRFHTHTLRKCFSTSGGKFGFVEISESEHGETSQAIGPAEWVLREKLRFPRVGPGRHEYVFVHERFIFVADISKGGRWACYDSTTRRFLDHEVPIPAHLQILLEESDFLSWCRYEPRLGASA